MNLTSEQIRRTNNLRFLIGRYCTVSAQCKECGGTGLQCTNYTVYKGIKDYSWDGHSFCDHCEGVGFIKWGELKNEGWYLCPSCNGFGCKECEYNGVVDWIKNVTLEGNNDAIRFIKKD